MSNDQDPSVLLERIYNYLTDNSEELDLESYRLLWASLWKLYECKE